MTAVIQTRTAERVETNYTQQGPLPGSNFDVGTSDGPSRGDGRLVVSEQMPGQSMRATASRPPNATIESGLQNSWLVSVRKTVSVMAGELNYGNWQRSLVLLGRM